MAAEHALNVRHSDYLSSQADALVAMIQERCILRLSDPVSQLWQRCAANAKVLSSVVLDDLAQVGKVLLNWYQLANLRFCTVSSPNL